MSLVFEKRKSVSRTAIVVVPVVSFLASLILTGALLVIFGADPMATYASMVRGAFGSWRAFTETLVKAIPLMLTGLGVALAFKLRFWNIGAEGQLTLASIAATWVALYWNWLPGPLVLPVLVLVGCAAGALWAGVPALLKTRLNVDETLVTLMLNYVALLLAEFLYYGPWRDPKGFGFPGTRLFPKEAWFPRIAGRAHIGLYFAIAVALILWFVLNRTRWGFELKVIGSSPKAARYQGIAVERNIMLAILLFGAVCGLAGVGEVAGISRRLQQGMALGYGFTAIIVAWMAQLNPLAVPFVALLMGALLVGGDQVQMTMGLPSSIGTLMQGMILFPMLAGSLFTEYRIKRIGAQAVRESETGAA